MWPSIKRWRDWAMHDLWNMASAQPQPLHYRFEKAGLTLHDQPVPWNAEAVVVEAWVRLPANTPRRKSDFTVRLPEREPVFADVIRTRAGEDRTRILFRFAPPAASTAVELFWRDRRLGHLDLPILGRDEFIQNLRLEHPTLFVRLGEQNIACQTFVSTQCRGLMACAMVTSPTSLVPLLDLGLSVEMRSDRGPVQVMTAQLSSSQLADRQALVSLAPPRFPRRIGEWTASWLVGDRSLISQKVRAISLRNFQRSLRVSDTRFVIQPTDGPMQVTRQVPPLAEGARVGPCFLVSSKEPGMAGLCTLQTRAQVSNATHAPHLQEQEVLISDGPAVVAPGTLGLADLAHVTAFELRWKSESLGILPMSPIPAATFTAEGGFKAASDFSWSTNADDELNDRLARLIDGETK